MMTNPPVSLKSFAGLPNGWERLNHAQNQKRQRLEGSPKATSAAAMPDCCNPAIPSVTQRSAKATRRFWLAWIFARNSSVKEQSESITGKFAAKKQGVLVLKRTRHSGITNWGGCGGIQKESAPPCFDVFTTEKGFSQNYREKSAWNCLRNYLM